MSAVAAMPDAPTIDVPVVELGDRLAVVRLCSTRDPEMAASLRRFGQLSPLVVFRRGDRLEVIDGFRRLRAAGSEGYPDQLTVRPLAVDEAGALGALFALHRGSSRLCELEEGWVVHALVRTHGLAQTQVAQLLRRHQSWVSRRLMLVEQLTLEVQDDVRLGLCTATAAREVARLPRGIQQTVARGIVRHGLSSRQAAWLCATVERRGVRDPDEIERLCAAALPPVARPVATDEDRVRADAVLLVQVATRLDGRLRTEAAPPPPALRDPLTAARAALCTLLDTLTQLLEAP